MRRILFVNTGGTISSFLGEEGLSPTFTAQDLLNEIPELKSVCAVEAITLMNVDSSNIQPENWAIISSFVFEALDNFDGIVISHGTDTMAYTASALSFMMGSLTKPVVLTGSQLPLSIKGTDAKDNIINAFLTACERIAGVFIVFNGKIIKGCRASKVRAKGFGAFESINYPYIGTIRNGKINYTRGVYHSPKVIFPYNDNYSVDVFLLKLIPGTNPKIFDFIKFAGYKGVVIESFGVGGVPFLGRNLLPKIKELTEHGICIAVTTQCMYDGSNLTIYEVGQKTMREGVIPGYNMTTETLVTKMMWALGQTSSLHQVARIMTTNYNDEVTLALEVEKGVIP